MATYNPNALVALRDTDEIVLDADQDVRGRDVVDNVGDPLGRVHDLLVDTDANKVRALIVHHGHLLDRTTSLIPVDAITGISPEEVEVDVDKDAVAGSPAYDPELVHDEPYLADYYAYYGYTPYWYAGYVYPVLPYSV